MTAPRIPRQGPGLQGPRKGPGLPYHQPSAKRPATGRLDPAPGTCWAKGWRWWVLVAGMYGGAVALAYWAGGG